MPKCPFAKWEPISKSSGPMRSGPYKIVHHTTEGSSAAGAMETYRAKRCDPHFTVDRTTIYQHIDTKEGARALRNLAGGAETNRDSAVQIELVGFAHQPKHPDSLILLARLCRWIEQTHAVPAVWPAGPPKPARNGKDPGGHTRDRRIWDQQGGHYGHCHVPENDHWDPGYSAEEARFLLEARFDDAGLLLTARPPQPRVRAGASKGSTMPDHGDVGESADGENRKGADGAGEGADTGEGGEGEAENYGGLPEKGHAGRTRSGRVVNARADTLDFRDRMYEATLIEVPTSVDLAKYLECNVPVLDQGRDGACTGFALATVAHYLLRKRTRHSDPCPVSARMFYELARRYDEWPGEDYEGSSARGAMKGWHKHGVCAAHEWSDHAHLDQNDPGFNQVRMESALRRPLGSYFRVNHKDLIAMHAAIAEVGILYATALVHAGWDEVDASGDIPFRADVLGGHAFAIVAYDEDGFWIQNSWGPDWGKGGLGRISYDDWMANGTDVWVARLGAPVKLQRASSQATAHSALAGQSVAYSYAELRPHLISIGNDGRLQAGGDYGTSAREVATIFEQDIEAAFKDARSKRRLLLYAHGGLVSEEAAAQRAAEYRATLAGTGVYPLAFIWRTDYWTTITNMLQDAVRRRRTESMLDDAKDFLLDRFDDALEPLVRELTGKAAWDEMKENAHLAAEPGGALPVVIRHIVALKRRYPDLEIHVVGHSAGSILLAPLVKLLTTSGVIQQGALQGRTGEGLPLVTCTLWAPSCTTDLFKDSYLPAIVSAAIEKFTLFCLDDKTEQGDHCAHIYNKSLLYLVSNALERYRRVPGQPFGVPLLGLEKAVRADRQLAPLIHKGPIELVLAPNTAPESSLRASRANAHGAFDDDKLTVISTFRRILAAPNQAAPIKLSPVFAKSANKLMSIRKEIDLQSRSPRT